MSNSSRRMRRMGRNRKKINKLNLTSLMDVFTILVFFLLFHSGSGDVLESPKEIKLPDSSVETKPRETIVILVSPDIVVVQGEAVIKTSKLYEGNKPVIDEISERLKQLEKNIIGLDTKNAPQKQEVTLLADKAIPFKVLKRIMTTCTISGYGKISLAVIQKNAHT